MRKIAIVTDDNAGIKKEELSQLKDVYIIGMPTIIDGETYFENVNLTYPEFFKFLEEDKDVSTSQPSPGSLIELWDKLLKKYDYVLHMPMSSGLSKSCETASLLAKDYDGKVLVIDNKRISVTLKQATKDAITLIDQGKSAQEIKDILESRWSENSVVIMVDTLKYLKKGGRVSAAGAALGATLHIKPVLTCSDGDFGPVAKALGPKKARLIMIDFIKKEIKEKFNDDVNSVNVFIAYTHDLDKAMEFKDQVEQELNCKVTSVDHLSLSVSCHIGPGALAIALAKPIK